MKKGLIIGLLAGAAAAAAGVFYYKKKQEEYNEYDEDIENDFEYDGDDCCCCECNEDADEMPAEKPADGSIETDHCTATSAAATADAADDTDTEETI